MIYSLSKIMDIAEKEEALGRKVMFVSREDGSIGLSSSWDENGITLFHSIELDSCREHGLEEIWT